MRRMKRLVACLALVCSMSACGNAVDSSIVLLGDSIIEQLQAEPSPHLNLGWNGARTAGILERAGKVPPTARHVFVEGGINDLLGGDGSPILDHYARILNALPGGARVHMLGILPVEEPRLRADFAARVSNDRIAGINSKLRALCSTIQRCTWVPAVAIETDDGIHPTRQGRDALRRMISGALKAG